MEVSNLIRRLVFGTGPLGQPMTLKEAAEALKPWPGRPLDRAGIRPGLYQYMREADGTFTRFHLRVDSTGNGLLLANAGAAARLRASGIIIAKGLLEGDEEPAIVDRLVRFFRGVTVDRARSDVDRVRRIIATLDSPGDNYPIVNLADPYFAPDVAPLDKPLSADVPLAEPQRMRPILDRLWELGVPHVVLVAGDTPDPAGLVRAVERAEDLGLIAGVRIRASDLTAGSLIADLAAAGVDHIDLPYFSARADVHDSLVGRDDHAHAVRAFEEIQQNEVCPVAQVGLIRSTLEVIDETLESLASAGISNACFFALATTDEESSAGALRPDELVEAARLVEESAEEYAVRFLWYPPVRFDPNSPLADQACRGPRTSGDSAVRIEPDGGVIPARGPYRSAGNLLTDDWEAIHRSDVFRAYRARVETDTHCDACPGLVICAADCPRNPAGWADARVAPCGG